MGPHAANNLLNDYLDVRNGVDTEDSPRAQYSPHPLLGGLTTLRELLQAVLVLNLLDAGLTGEGASPDASVLDMPSQWA